MIAESRKLTFSMNELSVAVETYLQSKRGLKKVDRITGLTIKDPGTGALSVTIRSMASTLPDVIELKPEEVAALMVAHCIRIRTPLPRRATKSIAVDGDRLSLLLAM